MRISDWSSDVFSSDLADRLPTEDIADVDPGRLARQRPGQRQVRGVENAGGDRLAGPAGDPGHADLGHVARSSMPTLRKRHMLERLALASRRLSSRHSLPGPISLPAALAVVAATGVVARSHTPNPNPRKPSTWA